MAPLANVLAVRTTYTFTNHQEQQTPLLAARIISVLIIALIVLCHIMFFISALAYYLRQSRRKSWYGPMAWYYQAQVQARYGGGFSQYPPTGIPGAGDSAVPLVYSTQPPPMTANYPSNAVLPNGASTTSLATGPYNNQQVTVASYPSSSNAPLPGVAQKSAMSGGYQPPPPNTTDIAGVLHGNQNQNPSSHYPSSSSDATTGAGPTKAAPRGYEPPPPFDASTGETR